LNRNWKCHPKWRREAFWIIRQVWLNGIHVV
jgi:hypothetical protein